MSGSSIGRFQVMALLQTARFYIITKDLEMSKSFGLNRAIFYAWAKHRAGRLTPRRARVEVSKPLERTKSREGELVFLGDEGAYVSDRGWFKIGDKDQTPQEYDMTVARRIEYVMPYEEAWNAALKYLSRFDKSVLLSQKHFYELVYKPVRDSFPELTSERRSRT